MDGNYCLNISCPGKLPESKCKSFTSSLPRAECSAARLAPGDVTKSKTGQPQGPLTHREPNGLRTTQAAESHRNSPFLTPEQNWSDHNASMESQDAMQTWLDVGSAQLKSSQQAIDALHGHHSTSRSRSNPLLSCPRGRNTHSNAPI